LNLHVNAGSPDMISQIGERSPGSALTLRLNPGFGHGHSQKTNTGGPQSKHGIWHEQLEDCLRRADQFGLQVSGLHIHIGSGCDLEHLSKVCHSLEQAALQIGRTVTMVSVGGGLPTPYQADDPLLDIPAYYRQCDEMRQRLVREFQHPLRLEVEPGRYLVAESGYLVTEVRAVKQMGENTFYLLDAGFNNLARPILYGAYHPMSLVASESEGRTVREAVVGGPLCESGDIFTQDAGGFVCRRRLPSARVGDLLVIECAGAYGAVMSSNYNSKTLAPEVLIDDGQPQLIRRRQTIDEMLSLEQIPAAQDDAGAE
jgi:diaminopimelate decarboxylase